MVVVVVIGAVDDNSGRNFFHCSFVQILRVTIVGVDGKDMMARNLSCKSFMIIVVVAAIIVCVDTGDDNEITLANLRNQV